MRGPPFLAPLHREWARLESTIAEDPWESPCKGLPPGGERSRSSLAAPAVPDERGF